MFYDLRCVNVLKKILETLTGLRNKLEITLPRRLPSTSGHSPVCARVFLHGACTACDPCRGSYAYVCARVPVETAYEPVNELPRQFVVSGRGASTRVALRGGAKGATATAVRPLMRPLQALVTALDCGRFCGHWYLPLWTRRDA